jgi:hypothetical protein
VVYLKMSQGAIGEIHTKYRERRGGYDGGGADGVIEVHCMARAAFFPFFFLTSGEGNMSC